jgi:hypothetical protein
MKTHNAIRSKWMRLTSGLMAAMFLTLSFAGQASARILFEDDLYLNVQSEGITLDSNNNVTVASAASIAIQDVTVTASATGSAGNSQTVTVVLADNSSGTCAVTGGTGTGVITVTCDDGTTSLDPGTTSDLQAAINPETLFVATGGGVTLAIATVGAISLANGADDGDINLQFGNDGTDATMKYNVGTQDITIDTPGNDINFSNDSLTTTGAVLFQGSSEFHAREIAGIISGVTPCTTVNELAVDSTTSIMWICYNAGSDLWAPAGPQDFEAVYGYDADKILTASGTFDINATGAVGIGSAAAITITDANDSLTFSQISAGMGNDLLNAAAIAAAGSVVLTGGTLGSATYLVTIGADPGTVVPFNTSLAQTAIDVATDITANIAGYSAVAVGTTVNITATTPGVAGNAAVVTTLGGDAAVTDNNATGGADSEIYESTGAIGSTIGIGETSTSLIHAINAVGTYATAVGAGAKDNIDDVYNNSVTDNVFTMSIDNASGLNFNINGAGGSFAIQDSGTNIAEFNAAGAVLFDPTAGQNFDATTLGAGDIVLNSADEVNVNGATVNVVTGASSGAVNIATSNTAGTVSIGTGIGAQILHFGDGLGAKTVAVGSNNTTSTTNILSGSGGVNVNINNGANTTNIGTGSTSGTVTIGGGSDNVTVNGKVVGITSNGVGNDVTLTAADDIIFDDAQLTGVVQMSDSATDWEATFSTDGIVDNINSFTLTTLNNGASNIGVYDTGANLENINPTGVVTDLQNALETINGLIGAAAPNVEDMTFYPEYPDAVVYPDTTNNKGTLQSFYDNASNTSYYNWITTQPALQDMGVEFEFPVPPDYKATGTMTFAYRTSDGVAGNNAVDVRFYNKTNGMTLCDSSTGNASAAWTTASLVNIATGCAGANKLDPGDIVRVEVKFYALNAKFADVGYLNWAYTN